jgi:hypothetical protein
MSVVECERETNEAVRCGARVYVWEERDDPLTANWYTDVGISVALVIFGKKANRWRRCSLAVHAA